MNELFLSLPLSFFNTLVTSLSLYIGIDQKIYLILISEIEVNILICNSQN